MPKSLKKRGRPQAWDETIAFMVGYGLGQGLSLDQVARLANISEATLYRRVSAGALGDPRFKRLSDAIAARDGFGDAADFQK
jgi:hypothetical protein